MAEQIPFSIAANLLMNLGSSAFKSIGLVYGVRKELIKLENTLDTVNAVLVDAEEQQQKSERVRSRAIASWIKRLKDVVYDADDLLDDFATEELRRKTEEGGQVRDFFSSSNHFAFRYKMGRQIKDIRERLDEIAKDMSQFSFISRAVTVVEKRERETHSGVEKCHEIVGREENRKEILGLLKQSSSHQNLSLVVIVGIGGLGKTTLAQLVYSDHGLVNDFDVKMWVCVSDNFDVTILGRNILGSAINGDVGNLELDPVRQRLQEKLDGKRYLLVLDDVWNEDKEKWERLRNLLPEGNNGSKILVTTRSAKVALVMGVSGPYTLEGLDEHKSWDLFTSLAFEEGEENVSPILVTIGKDIVKMCKGIPLVIKTVGRMLSSETREDEWLRIKNNENLMSLDDGKILSVLQLSYNALPNHLKQCFAYCALFPKDYKIQKNLLIQLWMAQGYIQTSSEGQLLEDLGEKYFEELAWRSFFQEIEEDDENMVTCKMHDLIHDLAQSIVNSEVSILTNMCSITERVHHASIVTPINNWEVLGKNSIRTFLLCCKYNWWVFDKPAYVNIRCTYLRALDLHALKILKVPKCLEKLSHLRYLDLSDGLFHELPEFITRLQNLQTLKLVHCSDLKELPTEMRKLIKLRHLLIHNCYHLAHMPSGIGQLTELQSLTSFVIGESGQNSKAVGGLNELKCLNNVRGELEIKILKNVRNAALESTEAILSEKRHLQSLRLCWNFEIGAELVMEGLLPPPNLKKLWIYGYGGVTFPSWMMNDGLNVLLPNLVRVQIDDCNRCQDLPLLDQLPSLKYLKLQYLRELEYMKESSSTMPFFPSLETLTIIELRNWKGWWSRGLSFPCLSHLRISSCHKLTYFGQSSFPCLAVLNIEYCAELTFLSQSSLPSLSHLEIRHCSKLTSFGQSSFPCLSNVVIIDCPELTFFGHFEFPSLAHLTIWDCCKFTSFNQSSFPCLSSLNIRNCDNLISFGQSSFPYLSHLKIVDCSKLTSFDQSSFPCLSNVEIFDCPELASLGQFGFPSLSHLVLWSCYKITCFGKFSSPNLEELKLAYVSKELLEEPMFVFSSLKRLSILCLTDLISLPEEGMRYLTSLVYLEIYKCPSLMSLSPGIQHLTTLETLRIQCCSNLDFIEDDHTSLQFQGLKSLRHLSIVDSPKLFSLPRGFQHVTTLETLRIAFCPVFGNLPDWIAAFTSLRSIGLLGCDQLKSLPEGMSFMSSLQQLNIWKCLYLTKRCQKETGEDWPKIAHIPLVRVD